MLALVCLSAPIFATDVAVSAQTLSQIPFNPNSIGNDRTITGVGVTNASVTITSTGAFPPQAVGLGGFQIDIGGDQYEIESVQSTSSARLTTLYAGSTGTVSITWYKWVVFRIYNTSSFAWQPLGNSEMIQPGTPGSGSWYKAIACSVVNPGNQNILWIPAFTISATTDSPTNNNAVYSFAFYRPDGSSLGYFMCGSKNQLRVPPTTPTTLYAICGYNNGPIQNSDNRSYTIAQIDNRFPSCLTNALPFYAATGNVQSCLTLGAGLTIAPGNILNSAGGSGLADPGSSAFVVRTSAGITTARTLTGTANEISITNGPGVLGNPVFALASTIDLSGKTSVKPFPAGASPPGGCSDGQYFYDNNAPSGQRTYACEAGTWVLQGGNAVINAGSTNQLGYYAGAGSAISPLTLNSNFFAITAGTLGPKASVEAYNVVTDFGCVGNGIANDTSCLANAITAAQTSGRAIYIPGNGNVYLTTGITITGRIRVFSDTDRRARIKSTTNAAIVTIAGNGSPEFRGPTVENLEIVGDVGSGANQIGLNLNDPTNPYMHSVRIRNVTILDTGAAGFYLVDAYSSNFSDLFIENTAGYPLLYNGVNMPVNKFHSIYVGNIRASAPAGFRIIGGNFSCDSCNGINNIITGSAWAVVGQKIGVDGSAINLQASMTLDNSNIESYNVYGIRHYSDSFSVLTNTTFVGDLANAGNLRPLEYEVITGNFPDRTIRNGFMDNSVVFHDGPYSNYVNSQVIRSNASPPVVIDSVGPGVAPANNQDPVSTYYDTTSTLVTPLKRGDAGFKRITVAGHADLARASYRYVEANCGAPCTITIAYPGWYLIGEELIIKDVSGAAATNPITITVNGGGTVNGGASYVINKNNAYVRLAPNDVALDWRVIDIGTPGFPQYTTTGGGDLGACFDAAGVNLVTCPWYRIGNDAVFNGNVIFNTDNTNDIANPAGNRPRNIYVATGLFINGIPLASLGTPGDSAVRFCSNCNPATDPCTSGGTGALAVRANSRWYCP